MKSNSHNHQADDPQTGEQEYQRSSHKAVKVLGPDQDSQPGHLGNGLGDARESDIEGLWDLTAGLPQDWGSRLGSWRAQTKPCVHQDQGQRSSDPTRHWARPTREYLRSPEVGVGRGSLWGWGHWRRQSWEVLLGSVKSSWKSPLALPQTLQTPGLGHLGPNN